MALPGHSPLVTMRHEGWGPCSVRGQAALRLEEEGFVLGVEEEAQLVLEVGVGRERRVLVGELLGGRAGAEDGLLVAPERGQLEVAAPLLPLAEHRALAADLE